jgi:membrane protease subunit (stomatin/prohibitin family)
MSLIQFTRNYDDLSTDRGYQFKFYCDKCGNGYMTQFETSVLGMAQSLLNVAGNIFTNIGYRAGNAASEVQRAIGGKAHDAALAQAVEEARPSFRQCTKCGRWVCKEVCWNDPANLCEECAPDFAEHLAANQAQAKAAAAQQQLMERAAEQSYAGNVEMGADAILAARTAATNVQSPKRLCGKCGTELGAAKFCPDCGTAAPVASPRFCSKCGTPAAGKAKFCPECGGKFG